MKQFSPRFASTAGGPAVAFTLIEMLVTFTVVCVLAALLMPAMKGVFRNGMAAKGAGNLRQLAAAQIQYASENQKFTEVYSSTNAVVWQTRLGPYLGITNADNTFWKEQRMNPKTVYNMPDSKPMTKRGSWEASVGMNPWMLSPLWNFRSTIVEKPAMTILLGEIPQEINGDGTWPPDWGARAYTKFDRGGRTNLLMAFCDGHVEALGIPALSDAVASRPPGARNLWHWFYQPGMGQANWE